MPLNIWYFTHQRYACLTYVCLRPDHHKDTPVKIQDSIRIENRRRIAAITHQSLSSPLCPATANANLTDRQPLQKDLGVARCWFEYNPIPRYQNWSWIITGNSDCNLLPAFIFCFYLRIPPSESEEHWNYLQCKIRGLAGLDFDCYPRMNPRNLFEIDFCYYNQNTPRSFKISSLTEQCSIRQFGKNITNAHILLISRISHSIEVDWCRDRVEKNWLRYWYHLWWHTLADEMPHTLDHWRE